MIHDTASNAAQLISLRETLPPFAYDDLLFELELGKVEDRPLHISGAGNAFLGQWKGQLKHGRGAWIRHYKDGEGDLFEGYFCEGKREGTGRMLYYDGTTYEGAWKNDTWSG